MYETDRDPGTEHRMRGRWRRGWLAIVAGITAAALVTGLPGVETVRAVVDRPLADTDGATPRSPAGLDTARQLRDDVHTIHDLGVTGVLAEAETRHSRIVQRAGTGDHRSGRPVSFRASFRGGSNIKTYLATVVLQLVDEGHVRLDDTVEKWLPGVVRGNGNDGTRMTIRDLLQHTSGLYDYVSDVMPGSAAEFGKHRFDRYAPRELVAIAMRHRPEFQPGEANSDGTPKWSYTNTGYVLLGMIVNQATGKTWRQQVRDRIIKPLRLHGTTIPGHHTSLPQPRMRGYQQFASDGSLTDVTRVNPSIADASGSMITTNADLSRFFRALLTGKLLSPDLLTAMKQTVATHWDGPFEGSRYGLGIFWYPLPCDDAGYWAHGGTFLGYLSRHGMSPDGQKSIAIAMSTQLNGRQAERQEEAAAGAIRRVLC